ncbi:uncharacterized protein FIBRA_08076 [Fibroporia radiculosa]|uniref:Arrestin-like N-terminal domain-containing protein n=1 Tax=Fibroporia radiculosa TaxID=599839 RepID=J4GW58_9APHY|nr:uncharacterized protein FIBRA_08076 [Fibroporia radiculosa]CCM05840.1 predicted protein [Fibroporia radiculosa]
MPESVTLFIPQQTYVSGSAVEGEVELDFTLVQEEQLEEVRVKLKGLIYTLVSSSAQAVSENEEVDILRLEVPVWTRGAAYPPPDSHLLRLQFLILLPTKIPPSCEFYDINNAAIVRYEIEAIGIRPGTLRMNKRIAKPIVVLPAHPTSARVRSALREGWHGAWNSAVEEKQIRQGLWGERAHVRVEMKYPQLRAFPIYTAIPFTVTISTTSKATKRGETSDAKPIWPSPPVTSQDIRFELRREVHVVSQHLSGIFHEKNIPLDGMDRSATEVKVNVLPKKWVPLDTDASKGKWKQQTTFSSTIFLSCTPTFKSSRVEISYTMHIGVPFSGWQNSVTLTLPVIVSSGMVPPSAPAYSEYVPPPPEFVDGALGLQPPAFDFPP